jgi:hypothetical protein
MKLKLKRLRLLYANIGNLNQENQLFVKNAIIFVLPVRIIVHIVIAASSGWIITVCQCSFHSIIHFGFVFSPFYSIGPWVGNCVGAYNHKFFLNFLLWTTLTVVVYVVVSSIGMREVFIPFISLCSFTRFISHLLHIQLFNTSGGQAGAIVLLAFTLLIGILGLFALTILLSHCYLLGTNSTTLEDDVLVPNPYNLHSVYKNFQQTLGARPIQFCPSPSLILPFHSPLHVLSLYSWFNPFATPTIPFDGLSQTLPVPSVSLIPANTSPLLEPLPSQTEIAPPEVASES